VSEELDDQVALLELGIVPVRVLGIDREAVLGPVIVLAVELERGRRHARLAVPPRTRSAIEPHHHGQVPVLAAEEDLAEAVAQTTRARAATAAARVWVAAE